MTEAGDSILKGIQEALAIARGEITSPHETRISQYGERMITRTIERGVEVRCEISRMWKTFFFDSKLAPGIIIDSPKKWSEVCETYRKHNGGDDISWLHTARAREPSLGETTPHFGFGGNYTSSHTLGEWAEQNNVNLRI